MQAEKHLGIMALHYGDEPNLDFMAYQGPPIEISEISFTDVKPKTIQAILTSVFRPINKLKIFAYDVYDGKYYYAMHFKYHQEEDEQNGTTALLIQTFKELSPNLPKDLIIQAKSAKISSDEIQQLKDLKFERLSIQMDGVDEESKHGLSIPILKVGSKNKMPFKIPPRDSERVAQIWLEVPKDQNMCDILVECFKVCQKAQVLKVSFDKEFESLEEMNKPINWNKKIFSKIQLPPIKHLHISNFIETQQSKEQVMFLLDLFQPTLTGFYYEKLNVENNFF